jgi:hypothetical protein
MFRNRWPGSGSLLPASDDTKKIHDRARVDRTLPVCQQCRFLNRFRGNLQLFFKQTPESLAAQKLLSALDWREKGHFVTLAYRITAFLDTPLQLPSEWISPSLPVWKT